MNKELQVLLDAGIEENLAKTMLKSLMPKTTTTKAKPKKSGKVEIEIVVERVCTTCGKVETHVTKTKDYVENTGEIQRVFTALCINCITMLRELSIDELVSLYILNNHPDIDVRNLTKKRHVTLCKTKSPEEWLGTRVTRIGGRDKEKYVETDDVVKLYVR